MSRIRTIKPEFFQSPSIATLTFRCRLTFIGLWTYVDDAGRCRSIPSVIAGQIWPLDEEVNGLQVQEDIDTLVFVGLLSRYEVDGKWYLAVSGWHEHQRINRPTPSRIPPPPVDESAVSNELSPRFSPDPSTDEDSLRTPRGKGTELGTSDDDGNGNRREESPRSAHGAFIKPWCDRHPGGTSEPCVDCAIMRRRYDDLREQRRQEATL